MRYKVAISKTVTVDGCPQTLSMEVEYGEEDCECSNLTDETSAFIRDFHEHLAHLTGVTAVVPVVTHVTVKG